MRDYRLKMRMLSDIAEKYLYRIFEHRHVEGSAKIIQEPEICTVCHLTVRIFFLHSKYERKTELNTAIAEFIAEGLLSAK
jgi:hypothetical protein